MESTKKKDKKNKKSEQRGFAVLLEQVHHNVAVIAEQHGDITKDIHQIKKTLDSHTEMIGALAVDTTILKEDAKATRLDINLLKEDAKATRLDINIMKTDIEFIKNGLKHKVDIDEFAALERRVGLLEKKVSQR